MISLFRSRSIPTTKRIHPSRGFGVTVTGMLMVGLVAAGCGGGSKSTTSTPTAAITKTEFIAKANAICGTADPALSAATAKLASHPTDVQIEALVKGSFVPSIEAQIAGIRALGVPPGEQGIVTRMLKLVQADLKKLKSNPALVATDLFGDYARIAHPYGLTACAPVS
jgi:hypothetical protein